RGGSPPSRRIPPKKNQPWLAKRGRRLLPPPRAPPDWPECWQPGGGCGAAGVRETCCMGEGVFAEVEPDAVPPTGLPFWGTSDVEVETHAGEGILLQRVVGLFFGQLLKFLRKTLMPV